MQYIPMGQDDRYGRQALHWAVMADENIQEKCKVGGIPTQVHDFYLFNQSAVFSFFIAAYD